MNSLTLTLVALLWLSSSFGPYCSAMEQEITIPCKNTTKKELILALRELPQELKLRILYEILRNSIFDFQLYQSLALKKDITYLAFSPSRERCLIGSRDENAYVWNWQTEELVTTLPKLSISIRTVAFSPDEGIVLTESFPYNHSECALWDCRTGELLTTFTRHTDGICSVAFSQTGEIVFTSSWYKTFKWKTKTGELLEEFTGHTSDISSWDSTACLWKKDVPDFKCVSQEKKEAAFKQFITLLHMITSSAEEGEAESLQTEPIRVKEIGAGLDIHSGAQQNCTIS